MDEVNDMLDRFYSELRKARRELNEYISLPSNKRNLKKLQELKDKYYTLEEIEKQI